MKRQIKINEAMGRQIEELVALDFPGCAQPYQYSRGPYDIETETMLIEVKSCLLKTKGWKGKNGQYAQQGRFVLLPNAHENLKQLAAEKGRYACYVFVVYTLDSEVKVVEKTALSWDSVDEILKGLNPYTRRKDSQKIVIVPHTAVFKQKRL